MGFIENGVTVRGSGDNLGPSQYRMSILADSKMPDDMHETTFNNLSDRESFDPDTGVNRGLKTRHVSMMALAGIIGTGIFVGVGGALFEGGPLALLIGFVIIGVITFSIMQSVGEISTLYPSGGAFAHMGERFVDKAFGAAVGWNYFIIWVTVLANEYNAVSSILTFWSDKIPIYGYFLLFWFAFLSFQMLGVTAFGEAEFWLALIKLVALLAYFIFAIVYSAGGVIGEQGSIGFKYWHDPGALADGFKGVANVFVYCSTFYVGVESISVAATETRNPNVAIPRSIRQVLWRILFVYIGTAFFIGITVPYNESSLTSGTSSALKSPMTVALQNAGWTGGVHLVNAVVLISCLSAINSSIYIGSRTVFYMAQIRMAPKFFSYVSKRGVPIYAVILTNLFGALALMNISTGAGKAYGYIINLSGVSTFLVWGGISFIHIRFRAAWKAQGRTADQLPFKAALYPYNAYFGLLANIFLALVQGWSYLKPFNAGNFVDAYILLPLFFIIYFGYKIIFRTRFLRSTEVDLISGRRRDIDDDTLVAPYDEKPEKKAIWNKLMENF